MLHVLLESAGPGPTRLMSWTSGAVAAHGIIVSAALWLTLAPAIEPRGRTPVEDIVYARPQVDPPPVSRAIIGRAPLPRLGAIEIPAVSVPRVTFPDYVPSAQVEFPAHSIFGDPRGTSPDVDPERIREGHEVERIVRPYVGNGGPSYPSALRSAGIEGDVLVRFVVDTLGRVEPRSVDIREATHALFGAAVREWLARTRYEPATVRGQPVRQLVEQRVGFSLRR
jgi:TonB family protein